MWEIHARSLGWEDPLEKGAASHSSILAWRISWTEEPGRLQSMGSQRVGHDWTTNTSSVGPQTPVSTEGYEEGQVIHACVCAWCGVCVCVYVLVTVVSDSLWPHGLKPTRLLCPWDSPGKNIGVDCHYLLHDGMQYNPNLIQFSSVQSLSRVQLFATPWIAACQSSLSITNSRISLKLTSIKSVMPSSHLILHHPLLFLPPIPPSIRVFSNESTLRMRWPKYWSFSFSIIPSKEHPGLISFRMDWLDLLAVQGTLKSLLQHHSLKASIPQHSAFSTVQLSHPYMTTGKTVALTRWTFVGKVMSLLFNMLYRLVIIFLPRSKHLLISWLQSPSAVILEPQK